MFQLISSLYTVGSKVTQVKPGDKVILSYTSCQACGACEAGTPAACGKWNDMNFMRWRNSDVGDAPGVEVAEKEGEGAKVYGSFFGQSSLSRRSIVSEGSVSALDRGGGWIWS